MMDGLISRRSATERLIIAKTLLETVLQDMTTAEPEIIRCKDCKWWVAPDGCSHEDALIIATANDFCSYGARMEESE